MCYKNTLKCSCHVGKWPAVNGDKPVTYLKVVPGWGWANFSYCLICEKRGGKKHCICTARAGRVTLKGQYVFLENKINETPIKSQKYYFFPWLSKQAVLRGELCPQEHCLKFEGWQGPPNSKQYEVESSFKFSSFIQFIWSLKQRVWGFFWFCSCMRIC